MNLKKMRHEDWRLNFPIDIFLKRKRPIVCYLEFHGWHLREISFPFCFGIEAKFERNIHLLIEKYDWLDVERRGPWSLPVEILAVEAISGLPPDISAHIGSRVDTIPFLSKGRIWEGEIVNGDFPMSFSFVGNYLSKTFVVSVESANTRWRQKLLIFLCNLGSPM